MALILTTRIAPKSDFLTYYKTAVGIVDGRAYIPDYVAVFPHTMGLSAVLSLVFFISGPSVISAQILGSAFSAVSVMLAYVLGKKFMGRQTGIAAAALWIFMPSRIMYTLLICTENVFNCLALCSMLLFVKAAESAGSRSGWQCITLFGLSGLLFSILAAIRPNGLILFIACLVVFVLFTDSKDVLHFRNFSIIQPIIKPACITVLAIAYLVAGFIVNAAIEAHIGERTVETRTGWNLYVGMNEQSRGQWNAEDSELFSKLLRDNGPEDTQRELLQGGEERLSKLIETRSMPRFLSYKTASMWYADHDAYYYVTGAQENSGQPIVFAPADKRFLLIFDGYYYVLLILTLINAAKSIKNRSFNPVFLTGFLFMLGTVALHIPFEAALRYKNHAALWLCILAAGHGSSHIKE